MEKTNLKYTFDELGHRFNGRIRCQHWDGKKKKQCAMPALPSEDECTRHHNKRMAQSNGHHRLKHGRYSAKYPRHFGHALRRVISSDKWQDITEVLKWNETLISMGFVKWAELEDSHEDNQEEIRATIEELQDLWDKKAGYITQYNKLMRDYGATYDAVQVQLLVIDLMDTILTSVSHDPDMTECVETALMEYTNRTGINH